jgi:hypothetical protein
MNYELTKNELKNDYGTIYLLVSTKVDTSKLLLTFFFAGFCEG